jgi:hypothetical protein
MKKRHEDNKAFRLPSCGSVWRGGGGRLPPLAALLAKKKKILDSKKNRIVGWSFPLGFAKIF